MLTNETLMASYEALKQALADAFAANEAAMTAKRQLEDRRGAVVFEGKIDGKNEAQREAQFRLYLADRYAALEACEAEARRARHAVELARLDVEMARAQLRLMELAEAAAA